MVYEQKLQKEFEINEHLSSQKKLPYCPTVLSVYNEAVMSVKSYEAVMEMLLFIVRLQWVIDECRECRLYGL